MKIEDSLSKDAVLIDTASQTKKQFLTHLASIAQERTGIDSGIIFDALIERERLGTTGVGKGVALPHIRLSGLKNIFCAFIKVNPIDFEAVDNKQIDLAFFLVVPEEAGSDHLKALARLSRLLRNEKVTNSLRNTDNPDTLYAIIKAHDTED